MSELPIGWAETTLGEITERNVDQNGPFTESESFCYVDISSIDRQSKRVSNPQILPVEEAPSRGRQRLQPGDVLVSMTRPNLNAVALVPDDLAGSIGSTGFHVLRSQAVSSPWIYYRVQAFDFVRAMSMNVQGALYPAVRPKDIAQFLTTIPPRYEQDRMIAEIEKQFTRLDAATAALKRVQANLNRYRASVLKAACEGRLVPSEAELARKERRDYEPADKLLQRILRERRARWEAETLAKMQATGKPPTDDRWKQKYKEPSAPDASNFTTLPEGWCCASADQVCIQITDGEHIQPPYRSSGRPLLTAKHVQDGWVDFRDFGLIDEESFTKARGRCAPAEGDVLIVSVGATTGRTGIVRNEPQFAIVRSVLLLRPLISPRYLLTWAQSPLCQDWIRSASGSTAQAHFYINDAKRMPVALAPEIEQGTIADEKDRMLSVLDALQDALLSKFKSSASLRQAILTQAFAGQLVPQDPTDEPASVLLERLRTKRASTPSGRAGGSGPLRRKL
jgi:type I restriction enzyme, S subunit